MKCEFCEQDHYVKVLHMDGTFHSYCIYHITERANLRINRAGVIK
jgi:intein-encoded DNA endonuclease-like protein